ncbi:MAG TPA: Ig-like domain-containing protein, partial [Micromonospora sp.]
EQPSYIGTSDFNGDGLEDIYEWTDQGDGFVTILGSGNGPLAPGAIRWCSGIRPDFRLSEFNREPGTDVVIVYADECATGQSGVVVLFGDGQAVHLQRSVAGDEYWSLVVRDVNGDNWPDVATVAQSDGETTWFLAVAGGGFVPAPRAVQDKLVVSATRRTNIRVLDNDYATTTARISIVRSPRYGRVQVTSSRTVVYTPNHRRGRTDRFVYRITDGRRTSTTSVNLRLR